MNNEQHIWKMVGLHVASYPGPSPKKWPGYEASFCVAKCYAVTRSLCMMHFMTVCDTTNDMPPPIRLPVGGKGGKCGCYAQSWHVDIKVRCSILTTHDHIECTDEWLRTDNTYILKQTSKKREFAWRYHWQHHLPLKWERGCGIANLFSESFPPPFPFPFPSLSFPTVCCQCLVSHCQSSTRAIATCSTHYLY